MAGNPETISIRLKNGIFTSTVLGGSCDRADDSQGVLDAILHAAAGVQLVKLAPIVVGTLCRLFSQQSRYT
jgi:hypothetical protein